MKPLRIKIGNPLPTGRYVVAREKYSFRHFPEDVEVTVVSDGRWVSFYYSRVNNVWECNAVYAAAHFDFIRMPNENK